MTSKNVSLVKLLTVFDRDHEFSATMHVLFLSFLPYFNEFKDLFVPLVTQNKPVTLFTTSIWI